MINIKIKRLLKMRASEGVIKEKQMEEDGQTSLQKWKTKTRSTN